VQGLVSLLGAGEPTLKQGISIYAYSANASMGKTAFYNSDGDFLIVPHQGTLFVRTLNGRLVVKPKEILIIPRGIKFSIDVEGEIKGWVAEVFGHHFSLPELGPMGANGLANPGDFESPTAWFEDKKEEWTV
jgi:homogentisate 1,2-dioxygenase